MSKQLKSSSQYHTKTKETENTTDPGGNKHSQHMSSSFSNTHKNSNKLIGQGKAEAVLESSELFRPESSATNEKEKGTTHQSPLPNSQFSKHSKESSPKSDNSGTVEVYEDNFIQEMKHLSEYLDEYNYVGMDTEFPGTVFCVQNFTDDFYYRTLKLNCDNLKLIQLGITLTNAKGEFPKGCPYHTWQFNFEFDKEKDKFSSSSMNLLVNCGIDFKKLKSKGIKHKVFAEYFMVSGLVLNPDVHWVSFQGSYDFGYLLRLLINTDLPKTEEEFMQNLDTYFPNYYDIRNLLKGKENLQGSLNRLAQNLEVLREGQIHQAGSDSAVTIDVFLKLKKTKEIDDSKIQERKNTLFGIQCKEDNEETIYYLLNSGCREANKFADSVSNARNNMNYYNESLLSTPNPAGNFVLGHSLISNEMNRLNYMNNISPNPVNMMNIGGVSTLNPVNNMNYYYSRRMMMQHKGEYSPSQQNNAFL